MKPVKLLAQNKDQQASEDLKVTHASYSPYNKKHLQMPIQMFKHKYFKKKSDATFRLLIHFRNPL